MGQFCMRLIGFGSFTGRVGLLRKVATEAGQRPLGHANARRVVGIAGDASDGVLQGADATFGVVEIRVEAIVGHIA